MFVADGKSWQDARDHCRDLSSDLVGIQSAEKNEAVRNASSSQTVWIGLFKDAWRWADGSGSSFRYWRRSQPNYLEGQDCVAAIFVHEGKWNDLPCTGKRRFFCQGGKFGAVEKNPCKTEAFVTCALTPSIVALAAMKYSPTTRPAAAATSFDSSSQGTVITHHFTVTNGPSATQSSTSGPTTVSPPTVTTELVSNTSTADIHNASSATVAAATSATPPETSVQPTASSITLGSGDKKRNTKIRPQSALLLSSRNFCSHSPVFTFFTLPFFRKPGSDPGKHDLDPGDDSLQEAPQ